MFQSGPDVLIALSEQACLHAVQGLEGVLPLAAGLQRCDERRKGAAVGLAPAQPHLLEQILRLLPVAHCAAATQHGFRQRVSVAEAVSTPTSNLYFHAPFTNVSLNENRA